MSNATLDAKAAELVAKATAANPANPPEKAFRRVPLSLPTRKLEVPEIPGYVCYWFRGTAQRLQQARQAGYEFVDAGDVELNGSGLANSYDDDGNSDLGSRISIAAGGDDSEAGNGIRMYLMKIKQELWDEDQVAIEARHEQLAATIRGDAGIQRAGMDNSNRYSRGESRNLFTPRRP